MRLWRTGKRPDLHAVIARLAGNRALELVALVCIRLTRIHQQAQQSKRVDLNVAEEVRQAHGRIVEAIVSRDVELARHRMRRHIDKLADFLR